MDFIGVSGQGNLYQSLRGSVRRSGRRLIQLTVAPLPYRYGWRWLNWLYAQPDVMRAFHPGEYEAFTQVVDELGISDCLVPQARKLFIIGNFILRLWHNGASREIGGELPTRNFSTAYFFKSMAQKGEGSKTDPQPIIQISGMAYLEEALREGSGVILLTYHSTSLRIAKAEIARLLGIDSVWTLSEHSAKQQYNRKPHQTTAGHLSLNGYLADLTKRAAQSLREGGLLHIVNDHGYAEVGTLPFIIGRRNYQLKPGFAELALATGADVIPYYSRFQPDGRIQIVIQPPMQTAEPIPQTGAAHSKVVHCMVESYARMVETGLRTRTESLTLGALLKYMRQPLHSFS